MRAMTAVMALVLLAGCQFAIPDLRPGAPAGGGTAPGAGGAAGGGAAGSFEAARAEDLCRAAASDGGFGVTGVAANTEIRGPDGLVTGRNVMLDVTRGGQSRTVRCAYSTASGEARLMVL